jgi:hypothetical protein
MELGFQRVMLCFQLREEVVMPGKIARYVKMIDFGGY